MKGTLSEVYGNVPIDDQMGMFPDLHIPVSKSPGHTIWSLNPADRDYLTPQTQEEHNRLLNTFYPYRATMPDWVERGIEEEKKSPKYSNKDFTPRKNLGVKSTVIDDMAYDKERNLAMLKMGDKWYTYSGTPEQFQRFLNTDPDKELNNIRRNSSTSLMKTGVRKTPNISSVYR